MDEAFCKYGFKSIQLCNVIRPESALDVTEVKFAGVICGELLISTGKADGFCEWDVFPADTLRYLVKCTRIVILIMADKLCKAMFFTIEFVNFTSIEMLCQKILFENALFSLYFCVRLRPQL